MEIATGTGLKRRFSLTMVAVFLAIVAIVVVVMGVVVFDIAGWLGVGFAENQVQVARYRALAPLQQEIALAGKMADSPVIKQWAVNEYDPQAKKIGLAELESYRRSFRDSSFFFVPATTNHYYFNDSGAYGISTDPRYTLDPEKKLDSWYWATLKVGRPIQINVNADSHLGIIKVWINVIIKDGDKVLGMCGTGIDLSDYVRSVVETGKPGTETVLVNLEGDIQAHREFSKIDFGGVAKEEHQHKTLYTALDDQAGRDKLRSGLMRIANGEQSVVLRLSIGGRPRIAALAPIEGIGWVAVSIIDPIAVAPLGKFATLTAVLIGSLLAMLTVIRALLSRWVLSRIWRLNQSATAIAQGNYHVTMDGGPDDEIGELAANFSRMADTVRDHTKSLELAVAAKAAEYEAAMEDLTRSNADLEQFAYVASHDLRQPLRMVSNYLSLIEMNLGDNLTDELKEYIGFAVGGAKRLDNLIYYLLEYSRIGKATEIAPVSMTDAIATALENLGVAIGEADARIVVAKDFPMAMGCGSELIRLLQNLIGNALKYRAPERPLEIDVGWKPLHSENLFWVKDNGIGIAPEDRDRAFAIFQRLVPQGSYEGTGIGLAICKKIVGSHGGKIWIDSEAGSGCTFFFTLPVMVASSKPNV